VSPRARAIVVGNLMFGVEDGLLLSTVGHHSDRNEQEGHTVAPCEGRWHLMTKDILWNAKCAIVQSRDFPPA
jgi:translation initiation factor 6 (eIF-6)